MAEVPPAWATESIRLVDPDPAWAEQAARASAELDGRLVGWLAGPVEHIGSTAVPGLRAKPILDLAAAVHDLGCASAVFELLRPAGWHHVPPELDLRPDRRFFVQVRGGHRSMHLQLVESGSHRWRDAIAFRDALRRDPVTRTAYADLKSRLAALHRDDREAYTDAKAAFVRQTLALPTRPRSGSRRRPR